MKKLVVLSLVLGLALLLAGTVGAQSTEFEVVRVAVNDWMGSGAPVVVTAEALFENLHDGDESNDPFLLDIRAPEDYAAAHIEGAVNIPFKTVFESDSLAQLPTDQQIAVICYTGHTASMTSMALNAMGYDAVPLKWAMPSWTQYEAVQAKAFKLEKDASDFPMVIEATEATMTYDYPTPGTGRSTTAAEVIPDAMNAWFASGAPVVVTAEALFENLHDGDESNDPFLLDIRTPEDYAAGHIEGAVNIPFKQGFTAENLAKLPTDQQIAVICYTGHTASMTSQMLNVLGYDAVPLKWAMPSWTQDEAVQAKAFMFEKDASDFPVVTAGTEEMAAEQPAELPDTGAPAFPFWLVGLVAGLSALVVGVALRQRLA